MKKIHITLAKLILILFLIISNSYAETLQTGDLIFQRSQSAQSKAIALITQSQYTHMGMIIINNEKPYVFEAANVVKQTPLHQWIKRGTNQHYVVKRLSQPLSEQQKWALTQQASLFNNKPYDIHFQWSDSKIYCSELVWKLYFNALGIEIGQRQTVSEFDLTHPIVKAKVKQYFGNRTPSPNEIIITPIAMFNSPLLTIVEKK